MSNKKSKSRSAHTPPLPPPRSPPHSPPRTPPRSPSHSPPRTPQRSPAHSPPRTPQRSPSHSPAHSPPRVSPGRSRSRKIRELQQRNATRKIGQFMRNVNPNKRRAYFLKAVCADSGYCFAFGKEAITIKKLFKNFSDFTYLIGDAKTIGEVSANGFVKELTYDCEGYLANTILKSSRKKSADNLLYEGIVGEYLNKESLRFPCFLETYGVYKYGNQAYASMQSNRTPLNLFTNDMQLMQVSPASLLTGCNESTSICINTQHIKNAVDFYGFMTNSSKSISAFNRNMCHELVTLLYQVYMPLHNLRDSFTHYDLHYKNVLLYLPNKKKYIHYHYHTPDGITSFRSEYILKIIDYGRSFFNDASNPGILGNSKRIYDELCRQCASCGNSSGFGWLKQRGEPNFISSQVKNTSHDLRLMKMVRDFIARISPENYNLMTTYNPEILRMLGKLVYDSTFGTKPSNGGFPNKIKNVTDAYKALRGIINSEKFTLENEKQYRRYTKTGDMHIYTDRPIEFIPA